MSLDRDPWGLGAFIGSDGAMAQVLPGFERRPGQEAMMEAVAQAIDTQQVLLVEAGTGVGKSLAYLLPSIWMGERVIVSTGTKALQEQLYRKDIPLLAQLVDRSFEAAILKGRTNYLCLYLLDETEGFQSLDVEARDWGIRIRAWASTTRTGDRAELTELPDDAAIWRAVSTGAEGCLGQRCPRFEECFVMQARRDAAAADVVIVNHHLFFADLSLRHRSSFSLLPSSDVVVFDEAHHVEDVAAHHFGLSVSDLRVRGLAYDVLARLRHLERHDTSRARGGLSVEALSEMVTRIRHQTDALYSAFEPLWPRGRLTEETLPADAIPRFHRLDDALQGLQDQCTFHGASDEGMVRLAERCQEIRDALDTMICVDDEALVSWVERGPRAIFLRAAPIDLSEALQNHLYSRFPAIVFTSATLTSGDRFDHIRTRLGLAQPMALEDGHEDPIVSDPVTVEASPVDVRELIVASPFSYPEQALLYTPDDLPLPRDPGFVDAITDRIEALLQVTEGRAFVLFTSLANMRAVHERLVDRLPWPTLSQGQGARSALLARFRETPHAVLFATATFWEGIDVVGEQLSHVIIDKLPFASPEDPLTAARIAWLRKQSRNPFREYQVPQAVISLKQGFGRLIRTRSDRGIVSVLDPRLVRASYGKIFLASLPDATQVTTLDALRAAWAERI